MSGEGALVPIIDVGALNGSDHAAKLAVAKQIGKACEEIGFFVIVNHGVPKEVIDKAWERTTAFFDLPLDQKLKFVSEDESKNPYGYSALGGEVLSRGKNVEKQGHAAEQDAAIGDLKEMFQMGPKNPEAGMPPRNLPQEPEEFAAAYQAYYDSVEDLARRLLGAFALALDLPEEWFNDKLDRHLSALRANNYPHQKGMTVPAGSIRCSAHTDYGTLTVLKSGGPGLQVSKDTINVAWHDVPVVEDGFVINLGDLMRRWTNERWCSTLHRVVNPTTEDVEAWGRRMALAFFHNLNKDAIVEAIPSCVSEERPALYDPIVAGEFLMLKHLASNGKAESDAHLKKRGGA
mmetsp:Transcript_16235/g.37405  ORF Transcript_16235/g.37405 Transcript_16235/m.37405 type:complete len:347 (-) Transcript_16235:66-1106(-)